jgi:hypothetical protein
MSDAGALSPAKRALLEQALRRRREATTPTTVIPRRSQPGPVPLSFTQQRLWFLHQWDPTAPTFNAARAVRLRGALDRGALQRALQALLARHESLRTVFAGDREPEQVVLESYTLDLPVIELAAADQLDDLLRDLAREPFDLARDLMLRATLIALGPDDHVLLLRIHHIAADAHSDGIIFRELSELYAAYREQREPALPDLPIQYADFTVWQHARVTGSYLESLLDYWGRQLEGAPPVLALPTDRPRPAVQRHAGAHRRLSLDRALAEAAVELSRSEGATFYMVMLAAFATLLYRRTGQDDIVIGSPIANRNNIELQGLVGYFSNTVALRIRLGGNPSFRDVLARTRETALGVYAHQDLPFDKVVEIAAPKRDARYNPLFQVNFRAQATERPALQLTGLQAQPIPVDIGFSRFDLALELELRGDALAGYFEYDEDLFEPATIDGYVQDFTAVLTQVTATPDAPVLEIKLARRRASRSAGGTIARRAR